MGPHERQFGTHPRSLQARLAPALPSSERLPHPVTPSFSLCLPHSRCNGVSPAPQSTHLIRLITATGLCPARHAPLSPPPWRLEALAAAPRRPPPPDPVPLASSPPRVDPAPAPPLCRGGGTAAPLPAAHTPTGDGWDGFPPPRPALDRPHPWRHRPCGRCHRHGPHPPLPPPTSNSSRWPLCPSRRGG